MKAASIRRRAPPLRAPEVEEIVCVEIQAGIFLHGKLVGLRGSDAIVEWPNGARGFIRATCIRSSDDLFGGAG